MATPEWMAQFFALATLIAEGAMVFGGVVPFAPQMVVIRWVGAVQLLGRVHSAGAMMRARRESECG